MERPETKTPLKCYNYRCTDSSPENSLRCSGCMKVRYCSKDCQKQDWKEHKSFCKHVSTNGTSSASFDDLEYYQKVAAHDAKAQDLANEIGLVLPTATNKSSLALNLPIRRLVLTGKDTPENFSLFFGQNKSNSVTQAHKSNRMEALLDPPAGSSMDVMARSRKFDENCPPRNVRPPSQAEAGEIKKIRDMQETIRRHMGARGVEDVTSSDMRDILVKNFGNRWSEALQVYNHALNSMDRNIRPPGIYD
ncbi:uncharacterized protein GGS22DRAFT_143058 [Annulohypoxylon maeteangense]|uniref:uncharacterized protein n=1 Tax=Annulohypoxylon maeteangense TaxID=1927788 RepID=UPI0020089EED|nr:uncharacterized protein GGS22DRAFT_143058 [Annulohypoxylon maeteangense]KAI0885385.1 hypothetical protein GGS22DRAFT_143058 [Annulohypoxylon maeteangense]